MFRSQYVGDPAIIEYTISHVAIQEDKLCFDRSKKRVMQQRWPHAGIK